MHSSAWFMRPVEVWPSCHIGKLFKNVLCLALCVWLLQGAQLAARMYVWAGLLAVNGALVWLDVGRAPAVAACGVLLAAGAAGLTVDDSDGYEIVRARSSRLEGVAGDTAPAQ